MRRFSTCLFLILSFSVSLSAQEQVITAGSAGEKVRFTSPTGIAQIRVQILAQTGDRLFDSAWKDGNVLDWQFESSGQSLANGSYRCVVMVKDLDGQVTEREASLTARDGQISIEARGGNEGVTVVEGEESGPKVTILVHDEKDGAIVSTSGDLSFRFGKFFAGKDSEKMRLTAEGNLNVDGVIHAKGIMFADGTVLRSAGGEAAKAAAGGVSTPGNAVERDLISQPNAASRRLTPRLNAPANQFVVDSAGVHIGTTSAYGLDVAGDVNLSSNLALPSTTASAGVITLGGTRFAHNFGFNNTFLGYNSGNFTMTGSANTATGRSALLQNATGDYNTAIGVNALFSNTDGNSNTASGGLALEDNTTGANNTASGRSALTRNTTGDYNTASGASALQNNITGDYNTASGYGALFSNTTSSNTANGSNALHSNTTGFINTASGSDALLSNTTGSQNTAIGVSALGFNTTGSDNTAIGVGALLNTTGSDNIAVGHSAGYLTTGNYNIDIGNNGVASESATIRIGTGGTHTRFFVAGVRGVTTGIANGQTVLIDSAGQLGTLSSSARVKRDITAIGEQSGALMKLRPVSFFYRSDALGIRQYGLIAEEVAEVMPELVQFSPEGEAETVRYHFLAPLLLDQLQKQQETIDALTQRLEALERKIAVTAPE